MELHIHLLPTSPTYHLHLHLLLYLHPWVLHFPQLISDRYTLLHLLLVSQSSTPPKVPASPGQRTLGHAVGPSIGGLRYSQALHIPHMSPQDPVHSHLAQQTVQSRDLDAPVFLCGLPRHLLPMFSLGSLCGAYLPLLQGPDSLFRPSWQVHRVWLGWLQDD